MRAGAVLLSLIRKTDKNFLKLVHHCFTLLLCVITTMFCFLWCDKQRKDSLSQITSEFANRSHVTTKSNSI